MPLTFGAKLDKFDLAKGDTLFFKYRGKPVRGEVTEIQGEKAFATCKGLQGSFTITVKKHMILGASQNPANKFLNGLQADTAGDRAGAD